MLVKGMVKELLDAPWRAKKHQPDGVVEGSTLKDKALTGITQGLPWCWPTLNEYTHGRVAAEVIMLGAGTGVGKTDFLTQQVDYDRRVLKIKPGVIFLEQNPEETMLRLIGKAKGKLYHVPQDFPEGEIAQAWEEVEAESAPIFLYDSFGATTWADVENRIRYMVLGEGCQVIYLDHLTALAAAEDDERTGLERIMSQMAPLAKELGVPFIVVSHLSTPEGKPHEEGGRVMIRHFKGSRAIGFWSWTMIGLERDQQAEDPAERLTTTVRMLKIRRDGRHTGKVMQTRFNENTGRLEELEAPMLDHSDTSFDTDKAPALAGALDF
jgi:twinkle protein